MSAKKLRSKRVCKLYDTLLYAKLSPLPPPVTDPLIHDFDSNGKLATVLELHQELYTVVKNLPSERAAKARKRPNYVDAETVEQHLRAWRPTGEEWQALVDHLRDMITGRKRGVDVDRALALAKADPSLSAILAPDESDGVAQTEAPEGSSASACLCYTVNDLTEAESRNESPPNKQGKRHKSTKQIFEAKIPANERCSTEAAQQSGDSTENRQLALQTLSDASSVAATSSHCFPETGATNDNFFLQRPLETWQREFSEMKQRLSPLHYMGQCDDCEYAVQAANVQSAEKLAPIASALMRIHHEYFFNQTSYPYSQFPFTIVQCLRFGYGEFLVPRSLRNVFIKTTNSKFRLIYHGAQLAKAAFNPAIKQTALYHALQIVEPNIPSWSGDFKPTERAFNNLVKRGLNSANTLLSSWCSLRGFSECFDAAFKAGFVDADSWWNNIFVDSSNEPGNSIFSLALPFGGRLRFCEKLSLRHHFVIQDDPMLFSGPLRESYIERSLRDLGVACKHSLMVEILPYFPKCLANLLSNGDCLQNVTTFLYLRNCGVFSEQCLEVIFKHLRLVTIDLSFCCLGQSELYLQKCLHSQATVALVEIRLDYCDLQDIQTVQVLFHHTSQPHAALKCIALNGNQKLGPAGLYNEVVCHQLSVAAPLYPTETVVWLRPFVSLCRLEINDCGLSYGQQRQIWDLLQSSGCHVCSEDWKTPAFFKEKVGSLVHTFAEASVFTGVRGLQIIL